MKQRLLKFLSCPECNSDLTLETKAIERNEIKEGTLTCKQCSRKFQIVRFIPRFVATDEYVDNFSFQWNTFRTVQIDSLNGTRESEESFTKRTGLTRPQVRDRLVLDVGVGAGRYADVVSRWGGEVIGFDLSFAVDAAYQNIGERENVHIVQADLFRLPFKKNLFDIAYSIGVLHHTPSTQQAFQAVVPYVKDGGIWAVWVYGPKLRWLFGSRFLRIFTTRMPKKWLYYLSTFAIPAYYVYRLPLLYYLLQVILTISPHPNSKWRWLDTFDWYSPQYQWLHSNAEVQGWFQAAGFKQIESLSVPTSVRAIKPSQGTTSNPKQ